MKCATITPNELAGARVHRKAMCRSPNRTIRNILNGAIFHEPIICSNVPRLLPSGELRVRAARPIGTIDPLPAHPGRISEAQVAAVDINRIAAAGWAGKLDQA
jgi:hypothetical protein